jgi:hypothetical protein
MVTANCIRFIRRSAMKSARIRYGREEESYQIFYPKLTEARSPKQLVDLIERSGWEGDVKGMLKYLDIMVKIGACTTRDAKLLGSEVTKRGRG